MENYPLEGIQYVLSLILKLVCFIIGRDSDQESEMSRPLDE